MKKRLVAGALVGGVLGLGGVVGAQDLGLSSTGHDEVEREVWLYADHSTDVYIDEGGGEEDGLIEVGDRNVFTETLYEVRDSKPHGEAYGHSYVECTVIEVLGEQPEELTGADLVASEHTDPDFDAAIQCSGTFDLNHDRQLYLQTLVKFSDFVPGEEGVVRGGILGGTGALAGAEGSFHLTEITMGDEPSDGIYRITLLEQ